MATLRIKSLILALSAFVCFISQTIDSSADNANNVVENEELECAICLEPIADTILAPHGIFACKHRDEICKDCIERVQNKKCPLCRVRLLPNEPNEALDLEINRLNNALIPANYPNSENMKAERTIAVNNIKALYEKITTDAMAPDLSDRDRIIKQRNLENAKGRIEKDIFDTYKTNPDDPWAAVIANDRVPLILLKLHDAIRKLDQEMNIGNRRNLVGTIRNLYHKVYQLGEMNQRDVAKLINEHVMKKYNINPNDRWAAVIANDRVKPIPKLHEAIGKLDQEMNIINRRNLIINIRALIDIILRLGEMNQNDLDRLIEREVFRKYNINPDHPWLAVMANDRVSAGAPLQIPEAPVRHEPAPLTHSQQLANARGELNTAISQLDQENDSNRRNELVTTIKERYHAIQHLLGHDAVAHRALDSLIEDLIFARYVVQAGQDPWEAVRENIRAGAGAPLQILAAPVRHEPAPLTHSQQLANARGELNTAISQLDQENDSNRRNELVTTIKERYHAIQHLLGHDAVAHRALDSLIEDQIFARYNTNPDDPWEAVIANRRL